MSQPNPDRQSQEQDNLIKNTNVSGDLIFAPVQIGTKIETQIVQISAEKVTQQPLIKTSPYQGLKRFNFKDREYFFGRDKLIARLFEAVNRSSLSLVNLAIVPSSLSWRCDLIFWSSLVSIQN